MAIPRGVVGLGLLWACAAGVAGDTTGGAEDAGGRTKAKLAITEIMYDPRSQETDDQQTEWVEVQNFGVEAVSLKGFQLTSGSKAKPHDPKQRFIIGDVTIAPGEYLLIGIGAKECYEKLDLPEMGIYVGESAYAWLTNDGDSVAIRDTKGKVIDEVVYDVKEPWPVSNSSGGSIQLVVPDGEDPREANDRAENWVASDSTNSHYIKGHGRGTPGEGMKQAATQPVAKGGATTRPIRARIGRKKS
jgi:hypothetical protein